MLRTDIANFSSSIASTSTALPVTPIVFSTPTAALVFTSRRGQRVDDDQRAFLQLLHQRGAQRALLDLLRDRVLVAARLRAERRAAVAPQRVAGFADARAAGALLAPGLLAAAADHRAGLGGVRAAAFGGVLAHHRFVDQVGLDAAAKDFVFEVDRADLLVFCVYDINLSFSDRRYFLPFFGFSCSCGCGSGFAATALRITT